MSEIRGEKVSFSRKDIKPLHSLPSSQAEDAIIVHCPPTRSRMRRIGRTFVLFAMLVLTAIGSGFLAIEGGIVDGTLSTRANEALNNAIGPRYSATVGAAAIRFDSNFRLALEAQDVDIVEQATGLHLSRTESMRMAIDPLALLAGRVSIRHMEADGIHLDAGALPAGEPMGLAQVRVDKLPNLLEQSFQRLDEARGLMERTGTNSISISGVEVLLPAAPGRKPISLEITELGLTRSGPGEINVAGEIRIEGRAAALSAKASVVNGVTSALTAHVSGIEVTPFLLRRAADGAARDGIQGSADLDLSATRARESTQPSIKVTLNQSPGLFYFDGVSQELSGGSINAAFDFSKNSLEILQSQMRFGPTNLPFVGAVTDLNRLDPSDTRPGFGLTVLVSGASATAEGAGEDPAIFDLRASGRYLSADRQLEFDDMLVSSPLGNMAGSLRVRFGDASPEISFGAQLPTMQVAGVKQLWPFWMARKPRDWVLDNLFGGTVIDGSISVFIPAGRMKGPANPMELGPDELRIAFGIRDTRLNLTGDIPPLRDLHGQFDLKGEVMKVAVERATSYFPSGRSVAIAGSTFAIPSTYEKPLMGELSLDVSGPADAIAELASFRPLNALKNTEFKPDDFTGRARAKVMARIGLIANQKPPQPIWSADLDLDGVNLKPKFAGRAITDVKGRLEVVPDAARLTAKAAIDEVPADVKLVEPVGEKSKVLRERIINASLNNAQRNKLVPGLDEVIDGTVQAEVRLLEGNRQTISLDLTRSALSVPWVGWTKGGGIPAKASLEVENVEGTDHVRNFELDGEGFGARGELALRGGGLQSARFSRMQLSPGDSYSVNLDRQRSGMQISVAGSSADMRPILTRLKSGGGGSAKQGDDEDATIKVTLDQATGFGDERLSNVSMLFSTRNGIISAADFSAVTRSGEAVVSRMNNGNTISVTSSDAGAVARFAGLYNKMGGGLLNVSIRVLKGGTWSGSIDVRNFALLNEARLQSIVSTPVGEDGRSLNAAVKRDIDVSSAKFQRGFARVIYRNGALAVENGVVRGEQIGASFQGVVRDAAGNMDLTGTFMPAYGLNRLFAELPIIGVILGNGRDRGLLGITFKLEGQFDKPRLTINPLSLIAPGIFRQIFEFQ
jgi:hypothetical protein